VNPRSGTLPSNLCLVSVMASKVPFIFTVQSTEKFNFATSSGVRKGSGRTGPYK